MYMRYRKTLKSCSYKYKARFSKGPKRLDEEVILVRSGFIFNWESIAYLHKSLTK